MASGDLLRKLLQSYQRRDDQAFEYFARQLVSEERQKHHHLLADDLERLLDGSGHSEGQRSPALAPLRRSDIPKDRERDSLLLEVRTPKHGLTDILLSDENRHIVWQTLREWRRAELLRTHGLQPRRRLLFCGPPGCGKTLCAEVLAQELGLSLLYVRFDAVVSSYLGETAANLRKVFDYAARGSWVLLFDEFDAIGKRRDDAGEHGELKRVVNSFLQLLDGFHADSLLIAATNHEALLDSALWRRFDDVLLFEPPEPDQIIPLMELKLAAVRHSAADLSRVAPSLMGMTHADIERVCRDAITISVLAGDRFLSGPTLEEAIARNQRRLAIVMAGSAKALTEVQKGGH